MTAFLFIPSTSSGQLARRVDFANIASLFAEVEDQRPRRDLSHVARVLLTIAILLGAIGDTVLVTRPGALTSCVDATHPVAGAMPRQATAL